MKTTLLLSILLIGTQLDARPLKVFILAGQSNMEGPAKTDTFDYHYLGSAKTFARIGKAFAEANLRMMESRQ